MKRKLAEHDNLKITIEQTGDNFHIKESSTFRTKDIDFTLGVPFEYALADGTEVSVSAHKLSFCWPQLIYDYSVLDFYRKLLFFSHKKVCLLNMVSWSYLLYLIQTCELLQPRKVSPKNQTITHQDF